MLLRRLKQYADERMEMPPVLYDQVTIRYIVELDQAGRLCNSRPIDTGEEGLVRVMPSFGRAPGSFEGKLFSDYASFTFGMGDARASKQHHNYRDLIERCASATNEPAVRAVATFLAGDPLGQLELPEDFQPAGIITFWVDGVFPSDLPSVQAFWAAEHDPSTRGSVTGQCIVCGQDRLVLERMQVKLRRLRGSQPGGFALISADAKAFTSYGLEASLVAPTCADCGERVTKALDFLLVDPRSHFRLGDVTIVFWTRSAQEDHAYHPMILHEPTSQHITDLLESVSGKAMPAVDETAFYAAILSANTARLIVHDWIATTVGTIKTNLVRWFRDQQVVDAQGVICDPMSLKILFGSTTRDLKTSPHTQAMLRLLLRAAYAGDPLPLPLLGQALERYRVEQELTPARAALIKLVLVRAFPSAQEDLTMLNPDHPNVAYQCGRLFAVLAKIQKKAIGRDAGVIQFSGPAALRPGQILGMLISRADNHLIKLGNLQRGHANALRTQMQDIMDKIDTLPAMLSLLDQGMFALGRYHQDAHDRAAAIAANEAKAQQNLTTTTTKE